MKLHRRTWDFELRAESTKPDGSYFEGHCAAFNSIDSYGTIMARGCFTKRLPKFLERGFVAGLNHDWDNPIGTPKLAREDEKGLFVGADVIDSAHGKDVRIYLKDKVCKRMSFGFDVYGRAWLEKAEDVKKYWESVNYTPTEEDTAASQYGALLFTEIEVFEFCPVMLPANENAEITTVRDGAAARQSLDDLLRSGAASIDELCSTVERYVDMRSKTDRGLQPERRAFLKRMHDRLTAALAGSEPKADPAQVLALKRDLLLIEAGLSVR